jgi:integrase
MPKLVHAVPRYSKHRASGQAVVTLSGQDFYCGPHGTKASHLEYDRQVAEWLARGRRPLLQGGAEGEITVVELVVAFMRHAKTYYRKHGKETSEVASIRSALTVVKQMYGREPANEFGPLKLKAAQQAMIKLGWVRDSINKHTNRIVRMFRWGIGQQLVRTDIAQALREVGGLHKDRSDAVESEDVLPVDDVVVHATLDHCPRLVVDMVRLQRLTGCRPDEVCMIRPCDVDTTGEVWVYRPESHKTEHHGRARAICIGPKAQEILKPYLLRCKSDYCFCPAEGEKQRRETVHELRITPHGIGNFPGTNRSNDPKRTAGERYTTASYRRAIHRGCEIAFGMPKHLRKKQKNETADQKAQREKLASEWRGKHCWAPNQLRHSAATEIRKRFGLEASQVVLGHSAADVTQVYAERDMQKAATVMAQVG